MPEILRPGPTQQIIAKAVQIRLGLKADEIIGAQRLDEVAMVRQHAQQLGRRERRVQEKPERLILVEPTQFTAERDHMIVVDPDQILRLAASAPMPRANMRLTRRYPAKSRRE